jgi:hypothetical protein
VQCTQRVAQKQTSSDQHVSGKPIREQSDLEPDHYSGESEDGEVVGTLLLVAGCYPAELLECLSGARREAERAGQLWGAAQALHETKGIPRDIDFLADADARISAVRLGMGEEAWEEAWRKGRTMALEEVVSYALEEDDAGA